MIVRLVVSWIIMLLIVLNGIEMYICLNGKPKLRLLIVLNGIEIGYKALAACEAESFNRTKWN